MPVGCGQGRRTSSTPAPPRRRRLPRLPRAQAAGAAALAAKRGFAAANSEQLADFLEQTTGAEREELEAKAKGIENPWHEAWCAAGGGVGVPGGGGAANHARWGLPASPCPSSAAPEAAGLAV